MPTDRQAALAAAAEVMGSFLRSSSSPRLTPLQAREFTTTMADDFMVWLRGAPHLPAPTDERLTPNVDFRSPSQARTERVDPSAVLAAAAERTMPVRTTQRYAGPHALDPVHTTPSGKYACLCGEAWPCSQRQEWAGP